VILASKTLGKDLLSGVVQELKQLKKPWQNTPEGEQRDAIGRLKDRIETAIEKAVKIIASENRPTLEAVVDTVTFKDGVKAVLQMRRGTEAAHNLADAQGESVLIVISGAESYTGGMDRIKPEKDQGSLALDDSKGDKKDESGKSGSAVTSIDKNKDKPI